MERMERMERTGNEKMEKYEKMKKCVRNQLSNGQEIKLFEKSCRIRWSMVKSDGKSVIL